MDLNSIGKKIKEARKMQGLTQEKLAELVNIHEKQLSKIETGKSFPTRKNLEKIFKTLNINFESENLEVTFPKNASKERIFALKIINGATEEELKIYCNVLKALKMSLEK